jgi:peptide/nickel transport system substrate-binding protein
MPQPVRQGRREPWAMRRVAAVRAMEEQMLKPLKAMVAATAIVVAACSGQGPTSSGNEASQAGQSSAPQATTSAIDPFASSYSPAQATKGGQILIGDWQEANQFNPFYYSQVTEANVASATWAGLVVPTNDYKYLPDLAAEPSTADNGGVKVPGENGDAMTVTWKLKPDLKWSDGQALTCDDFAFTWHWIMDPGNTGLAAGTTGYDQITKVDCPDPSTIVYHFKTIYEAYLTLVIPLPKHYLSTIPIADQVKGKGFQPADMPKVPTSGAFKFQSVTSGQELRLARNENYKGFKSNQPANLDTLIWHWYGDADAMIAGFAAGEVDFATDLQDSDIPKLETQGLHDNIAAEPSLTYEFLRPNWADGKSADPATGVGGCSRNPAVQDRGTGCPMADPAMRQAVAYAVDKNEINAKLLGGTVQIANSNTAPQVWYYADEPPATFDPNKANQILDQGGWVKGADGIRSKNGLKAKIELCTTTRQVRLDTLTLVTNWLKAVGIEGVVNGVSSSDIFAEFNDGTKDTPCALSHSNFDLAEHAFSSPIDPINNYLSYHSSQFEPKGANDAQVSDPALDKALEDVKNNVDFTVIKNAMKTFQDIYVSKTVEIPLYYRKNVDLVATKLGNYFQNPTSAGPTWNVVDWFAKQ